MEILPHENWKWRFYSMKIEKMEILPHKNWKMKVFLEKNVGFQPWKSDFMVKIQS
jgi:hypothetical protein